MSKSPFTAIVDMIERAARNGTKAHLDIDMVRALVASPAFTVLTEEKRRELVETWQENLAAPRKEEPSSARSGSGIGPTGMIGASVGTMTEAEQEAVELVASQRALEAVEQTRRRRQPRTP